MFLKPNKKKIISTIIILVTIFISGLIQDFVAENVITSKLPMEQIEATTERFMNLSEEDEKAIEKITSINISEVTQNISDFTEEDMDTLKYLIGEDLWEMSEKYVTSVNEDPFLLVKDILSVGGVIIGLNFLITVLLTYASVCYILTFSISGELYSKELKE